MSMAYIALFHVMGYIANPVQGMLGVVWVAAFVATTVEAMPIYGWLDDNLTVPVTAAVLGQLLMQVRS